MWFYPAYASGANEKISWGYFFMARADTDNGHGQGGGRDEKLKLVNRLNKEEARTRLAADAQHVGQGRAGEAEDLEEEAAPALPGDAGPLAGELAAMDRALTRSTRVLAGDATRAELLRNPLIYDPDSEEDERLEAWRRAASAVQPEPPLLAAALLWDAWETNPPLARQAWLGPLLISATLRTRRKTRSHLFCVNSALRCVRREQRRSPDRATRLAAFLEAIALGAEAAMKDHDRWLLARKQLEGKLTGRRSSSRLPALVEFILARPIASAGMIAAALGVTPRAAQAMAAELGLREITGRGRYRAWGIL